MKTHVYKKAVPLTKGATRIVSGGNGSGNEPQMKRSNIIGGNGLGEEPIVVLSIKPASN
ncbi:hypothetical protein [Pseudoalteromonas sp. R3]|uniref:hypothetical protein n=1 Tax=Pseudoalteromonas sp. R3 TaxID=1709477 RepID=UPI000B1CAA8A|nr:hypothetical protein [Pseudoalteromonas sp. R3]